MLHDKFLTFHLQHQEGFSWLGPMGDRSFVIKQADCFPKVAKNTHTLGMV